jgi:hypothetical protein
VPIHLANNRNAERCATQKRKALVNVSDFTSWRKSRRIPSTAAKAAMIGVPYGTAKAVPFHNNQA